MSNQNLFALISASQLNYKLKTIHLKYKIRQNLCYILCSSLVRTPEQDSMNEADVCLTQKFSRGEYCPPRAVQKVWQRSDSYAKGVRAHFACFCPLNPYLVFFSAFDIFNMDGKNISDSETDDDVWLFVKNLGSGKYSVKSSSSLWEIDQVGKKEWRRVPFQPKTVEEFNARKEREKTSKKNRTDYGIPEGEYMHRFYVICASGKFLRGSL